MKTYTNKQLEKWTKRELIHYILILQFNYLAALRTVEQQVKNFQQLLSYREEVEHEKNND